MASGDFTDIQKAIDYVNGLGGGTVYIKAGTYNLTTDLIMYSNIHLVGEDTLSTILDFGNNSLTNGGITAIGTKVSTTGDITLTNNSTSVSQHHQ